MNKSLCLIIVFLLSSILFAAGFEDVITEKQKQLEAINQQIESQKKNLVNTEKQVKDVADSIQVININLQRQMETHAKITSEINETNGDIADLRVEIGNEKVKYDQSVMSLAKKFDLYYRLSQTDFIDNLFDSDALTDYINDSTFFEAMISSNVEFLGDVREQKENLSHKQDKMQDKLTLLKDRQEAVAKLKAEIEDNKKRQQVLYDQLMSQKKEYERKVHSLEQDSDQIQRLITKMQQQMHTAAIGDGKFIWPVVGEIASPFGERIHPIFKVKDFHTGLDIAAPLGRPVFAASDGVVLYAGVWGGYGNVVIIDHGAGMTTLYGHLSQFFVKRSVTLKKGQILGLVGSTGWSTGPHLHFEVRVNGEVKNPINYLPKK